MIKSSCKDMEVLVMILNSNPYGFINLYRIKMSANNTILRLATYMCPGIPVEYYEFLAEYLEHELGLHTELLYSTRSRGPDTTRGDQDRIDLGKYEVKVIILDSLGNGCCLRSTK